MSSSWKYSSLPLGKYGSREMRKISGQLPLRLGRTILSLQIETGG
jgi:hypothetical protein